MLPVNGLSATATFVVPIKDSPDMRRQRMQKLENEMADIEERLKKERIKILRLKRKIQSTAKKLNKIAEDVWKTNNCSTNTGDKE
jgi:hypothetical protein